MSGDILTVKNSKTGTVDKRQCLSSYYIIFVAVPFLDKPTHIVIVSDHSLRGTHFISECEYPNNHLNFQHTKNTR